MSNDLRYDSFEVYAKADGGNSIYNVDNYASTTTFYPDGKFSQRKSVMVIHDIFKEIFFAFFRGIKISAGIV